jgi:hypothetical protein
MAMEAPQLDQPGERMTAQQKRFAFTFGQWLKNQSPGNQESLVQTRT